MGTLTSAQLNVIKERNELAVMEAQLRASMNTKDYAILDVNEQRRIQAQLHHMSSYLSLLNERINNFG